MFSLPIIHSFRFCQMCMKCWNIPMETHKSLVNLLKMFNAVPHCLEILFTNMKIENRSMWLSMWNAMSCQICEKYFKNKWEWQNTCQKAPTVFTTHSTSLPPSGQQPDLPSKAAKHHHHHPLLLGHFPRLGGGGWGQRNSYRPSFSTVLYWKKAGMNSVVLLSCLDKWNWILELLC